MRSWRKGRRTVIGQNIVYLPLPFSVLCDSYHASESVTYHPRTSSLEELHTSEGPFLLGRAQSAKCDKIIARALCNRIPIYKLTWIIFFRAGFLSPEYVQLCIPSLNDRKPYSVVIGIAIP